MQQVAQLLFAAGFTYLVSLCAGKMLLQVFRVKLYRAEAYFFSFVMGSAVLSTLVFALTAARLAYAGVFLAVGLAIIALAVWRKAYRFPTESAPPLAPAWRAGLGILYAVFAVLYLKNALLPEVNADAILYHVALPARYLREHGFPPSGRNMMANLSEGIEMLFLFAFAFGRHSAGAMVHLLYTLVLPFGMLSYGRRVGLPEAGAVGGMLFFMSPVVGRLGSIGYIDVAVACVVFAVFYLLEIWREDQSDSLLVAVGLLAGFCYAAKYSAGVAVPYALAVILWRRRRPRSVVLFAVCALFMMSPYLVKNAIVTGNPFSPFFNQIFPNPAMTVSLERTYAHVMRHWEGVPLSQVPLEVTVRGFRLQGIVGPVFLLAPLALLALRLPVGRRLWLAGAVFTLPYFASIATRFLVPVLPFLSLALACALARWRAALAGLVLLHAILSWPRVVPRYCDDCWRLTHIDWSTALRQRPEEDFLRREIPDYAMGLAIEKNVPRGQPVFAFQGFQQAYQSHEIVVWWQSAFGQRLATALLTPVYPAFQPTRRVEYRFPEKAVGSIRLVQRESSEGEWTVAEVRVFRQGAELRPPPWQLRASHNPWDAQLAFDNNPVTRWSSGQPRKPGMWLRLDFGEVERIDGVIVECTPDQPPAQMRVELESAPGLWADLGDPVVSNRPSPPGLRLAAAATLKRNRVYWLLVGEKDPIANDIAADPAAWDTHLVASKGTWRLYGLKP